MPPPRRTIPPHIARGRMPPPVRRAGSAARAQVLPPSPVPMSDVGAAVAEALFGVKPIRVPPRPEPEPEPESAPDPGGRMEPMPIVGSVLQFTPESRGWYANLTDDSGACWEEPIVGWAVVVNWTDYDDSSDGSDDEDNEDNGKAGTGQYQTEIQPVTLGESGTMEIPLLREVTLVGLAMPGMVRVPVAG